METFFQQTLIDKISSQSPVYIVGGAVRDMILGRPSADLDVVLPLSLDEIEEMLKEFGYNPHRLGKHRPTVSVFNEGERVDILPIEANLPTDALNRDFTINAMYYDPVNHQMLDPLGGQGDLQNGQLKTCRQADLCFEKDPLRILRMIRFAVKYKLTIDQEAWDSGCQKLNLLADVPAERITEELSKILLLENVENGIRGLGQLGYWRDYLPELARLQGLEQNKYHTKDAWEHTLQVVSHTPPRIMVRLAALFHDLGKYETASRECIAWGRLEQGKGTFILGDYVLEGHSLASWADHKVEVLGGRLDHYPDRIVVKKIRRSSRSGQGFEWVADGKRHFLNHEQESVRLVKELLPRFKWPVVLNRGGQNGEKELLHLIGNHMLGTFTFMKELQDERIQFPDLKQKARKMAWDAGFDSRAYKVERVMDLLDLWKGDFLGGKARKTGDGERFAHIQEEVREAAWWLEDHWATIDWWLFDEFARKQALRGENYGLFRIQVRRSLLVAAQSMNLSFLDKEYKVFLSKMK